MFQGIHLSLPLDSHFYLALVFLQKQKSTLKDVSLVEAGKYGSLNEYAFFDKVNSTSKVHAFYFMENLVS